MLLSLLPYRFLVPSAHDQVAAVGSNWFSGFLLPVPPSSLPCSLKSFMDFLARKKLPEYGWLMRLWSRPCQSQPSSHPPLLCLQDLCVFLITVLISAHLSHLSSSSFSSLGLPFINPLLTELLHVVLVTFAVVHLLMWLHD